ncbi:MAG TPA: CerR family C-terminal domain-containing protein [Gemmatimonadales bacterium]|nr:CerR family C-terminal domain-containing protein [Gemmatimonadales bacterium]
MRKTARRLDRTPKAVQAGTRAHLLDTATRLFAERGFSGVTVRDICRDAHANVAAVNYYFGDKLGLYRAVVDRAIAVMRETSDAATNPEAQGPEERLRHYVRIHFDRLANSKLGWIHKLMQHELDQPTPAAARIVEEAIEPRIRFLRSIVAELLQSSPTDPRVARCVASVQTQCLFYARLYRAPGPFRTVAFPEPTADVDALADHIAEFSLAGIHRVANEGQ